MFARELKPGDGQIAAEIWEPYLPPDPNRRAWLAEVIDAGCEDGVFRGAMVLDAGISAGFGLSAFIPDHIAEAFMAEAEPYLNDRLLRRWKDGDKSMFLDREGQASGNSGDGLELLILEGCGNTKTGHEIIDYDLINAIIPAYHRVHDGFNVKRHLHETELKYANVQYSGGNQKLCDLVIQHPFSMSAAGHGPRAMFGLSRRMIDRHNITGHANVVLHYVPPILGLLPREQQICTLALSGLTDVEVAGRIGISRDAVKQYWQVIYGRMDARVPDVLQSASPEGNSVRRGPEKRRRALAYIQMHLAELRPHLAND
ncbi:helix-turn-helix transcriptional regulator [Yoonia sp. SDW83-1]|uniref:helix-turn-helix transcriptional regulator n=1 Tax=Yoonia sp. SDW83-1 TaxID=3366945 RepID=UPI00398C3A27